MAGEMVHSTPSQVLESPHHQSKSAELPTPAEHSDRRDHRSRWGLLCSAGLSLATLVLLCKPWLSAHGPNGEVSSDAFGRISGATGPLGWVPGGSDGAGTGGSIDVSGGVNISGVWAVLAAAAAVVTIFAAVINLRVRREMLAYLVVGSSVAGALCVLFTVLYLNGMEPELRAMTEGNQHLSGGLDNLLDSFLGDRADGGRRQIASASLDPAALLGGVTALGAALSAIMLGLPKGIGGANRYPAPIETMPVETTTVSVPVTPASPAQAPRRIGQPGRDGDVLFWQLTSEGTLAPIESNRVTSRVVILAGATADRRGAVYQEPVLVR
ncbi:hypothetical protein ABIA39_005867 [Nocardia sp. GAS34]